MNKDIRDYFDDLIGKVKRGELIIEKNSDGSFTVIKTGEFVNNYGNMNYEEDCIMYPLQSTYCDPATCSIYETCNVRILKKIRRNENEDI